MQKTFIENPPPKLFLESTARFSPCGKYRYELFRRWAYAGKSCCFIMLNPSTADAEILDPTVRRCIGFAQREGCASLTVLNVFAFRATDPKELRRVSDPESEGIDWYENRRTIKTVAPQHDLIICAWGDNSEFFNRTEGHRYDLDEDTRDLLSLVPLKCLGLTQDGFPRHPLYVKADAPLIDLPRHRF